MATVPKRATGANIKLRARFETTYGARAAGNFVSLRAFTWGLSKQQPLEREPLLGGGRDPERPQRGAIDVTGSAEVPVDQRLIGYWLKGLLGDPDTSTVVGARGFIEFPANPVNSDTITLDGTVWTFVAAAPAADETLIGADLATTLATLVTDLNASADPQVVEATYSTFGDRLAIDHDTADATGDSFTLAASDPNATLSGATLAGGGQTRHEFRSGGATLPSLTVEVEHGDLEGGSNRFIVQQGVLVNALSIERQRSGVVKAALELIGQSETAETATVGGTPLDLTVAQFSQFQGSILVDGIRAANVTAANLQLGNQYDVVEALRADGLIEGADAGETLLELSFTARFSNNALKAAAEAAAAIDIRYGFREPASGAELLIQVHQVDLPTPARAISGPGGIEVTYEGLGSKEPALARALTVSLWNDRADYANPA